MVCAAAVEGDELDAGCGKRIANARVARMVLTTEAEADRTRWHLLSPVIVLF